MQLQLSINIPSIRPLIEHQDKVLLVGSCFTEHMSGRLAQAKWQTMANPNGILFNPLSVADALMSYVTGRVYESNQLFLHNELWQHWDFHSQLSHINVTDAVNGMNTSIAQAHDFLKNTNWLIITLGSAYQYYNIHEDTHGVPVANCHRAPGKWFDKRLLSIDTMMSALGETIRALKAYNPQLNILFTISPVRHIRDGVIENNRSKARLLETVHSLVEEFSFVYYFPAYEIAIDVLRDYRFYDIDMVHPNYACTEYIWEQFVQHNMSEQAQNLTKVMKEITTAFQHRTRFPETEAHKKFILKYKTRVEELSQQYSYTDWHDELNYFNEVCSHLK